MYQFDAKTAKTISRIRAHYNALIDDGYTDSNAFDRIVHDHGDQPAAILAYAANRALTPDDEQALRDISSK